MSMSLTVGATRDVECQGGLRVQVSHLVTECPPLDALIVPGGPGADDRTSIQDSVLLPFLRERGAVTPTVASVCTGAFLLARAGLLDGRRATTHSQALPALRAEFPDIDVVGGKIVDEGPILSAAGVSSGIDLALHLLRALVRARGPGTRRDRARRPLDVAAGQALSGTPPACMASATAPRSPAWSDRCARSTGMRRSLGFRKAYRST